MALSRSDRVSNAMGFFLIAHMFGDWRSSPNRDSAEDFVSEEQMAWYSGFKAGLICSRLKIDISLLACSNKATISMLFISSFFLVGQLN